MSAPRGFPGVAYCLEMAMGKPPTTVDLMFFVGHLQAQLTPEEKLRLMASVIPEFGALIKAVVADNAANLVNDRPQDEMELEALSRAVEDTGDAFTDYILNHTKVAA